MDAQDVAVGEVEPGQHQQQVAGLDALERAGLIERGRTAQLRPSRIRGEPLKEVADWLERYGRFWDQSFYRLESRLRD